MNSIEMAVLNLEETRRRSVKMWRSLPDEWLNWRPDKDGMSFGEMIRHVWEGSYQYHMMVKNNGSIPNLEIPFKDEPIISVENEISLSKPYFVHFIGYIKSLSIEEMSTRVVDRTDVGYKRNLGDMLLRIAYHDSVHTGQFLQYMRMVGLKRPQIWD